MAAVDYFLKLDGIPGESTDDKHKGEIDVDSFSWGVSQAAAATRGGGGAGKAVFQDFHFSMRLNRASPQVFLATATGRHLKSGVLVGRKAGGDRSANEFIKYSFTDLLFSAYGEAGSAETVEDQAAFRYANVQTDAAAGPHVVPPASFGAIAFDPRTGKAVVVEGAQPHLTVGAFGAPNGGPLTLRRGLVEYDLSGIPPLLSGPGSPRLTLTLTEVREAAITPDTTNLAKGLGERKDDEKKPKKAKRVRFIVLWYETADLTLTADDFDRKAHRLTHLVLDPTRPPVELPLDLTALVARKDLDRLGIRIQSALDHSGREDDDDEDRLTANNDNDRDDDEEAKPTGVTNAMFDVALALTFD